MGVPYQSCGIKNSVPHFHSSWFVSFQVFLYSYIIFEQCVKALFYLLFRLNEFLKDDMNDLPG